MNAILFPQPPPVSALLTLSNFIRGAFDNDHLIYPFALRPGFAIIWWYLKMFMNWILKSGPFFIWLYNQDQKPVVNILFL